MIYDPTCDRRCILDCMGIRQRGAGGLSEDIRPRDFEETYREINFNL